MLKKGFVPGILGMLTAILGLLCADAGVQRWFFLIGALGMSLTAVIESHPLFVGLQMIVLSGTAAAFLPVSEAARGAVPLGLSLPVLWRLNAQRAFNRRGSRFGAVSLLVLAGAYALQHPAGFFLGGILVSIFSAVEIIGGFRPAIIWLILNLAFTVVAGIKLLP